MKDGVSPHELEQLAAHRERHCVSLYLPQPPPETPEQHRIGLKNLLREAERLLAEDGLRASETDRFLQPIADLAHQSTLWRFQRGGLVILRSPSVVHVHHIPLSPEPLAVVGQRFHLTPLLPLAERNQAKILSLSLNHVRLFDCNRYDIQEVPFDESTPRSLNEALGRDLNEQHLQWHTAWQQGFGLFHSQGEGDDDRKMDTWRFLVLLDHGLQQLVGSSQTPILLAGVDSLTAAFRDTTRLKCVIEASLSGNFEHHTDAELHERAWPLLQDALARQKRKDAELLQNLSDTARVSRRFEDVLDAALDGRIHALFLRHNAHRWGTLDTNGRQFQLDAEQTASNEDLLDLAAVRTFTTGGRVYLVENQPISPENGSVTAVYRY